MFQLKTAALIAVACFGFLPVARAVSPAPDGGYPNNNTAEGTDALFSLDTSLEGDNTAVGFDALYNSTGSFNTALGAWALVNSTTGHHNTAVGASALFNHMDGYANTATGESALYYNITGSFNTGFGANTLYVNETGNYNTAVGQDALGSTTGDRNIALGFQAGNLLTTGSNNIDIGNGGGNNDSGTIRLGTRSLQTRTFIAGIYGVTTSGGISVYIGSSGKLGTTTSSARFKQNIRDMADSSDVLLSLRPVAFRYKPEIDPEKVPQFGLVAEEVEKVDPDLVVRDADGKPYTVRYDAVNAMLLNEFLKEHRKVEAQDRQLQTHAATIARQQKQIEALTAELQKVNDKLELSNSAPQLVNNR